MMSEYTPKVNFTDVVKYFINPEIIIVNEKNNSLLTLQTRINQLSATVFQETSKIFVINPFIPYGGATTIITTNEVFKQFISKMKYFYPMNTDDSEMPHIIDLLGYKNVGILNGRLLIYTHEKCTSDRIYLIAPNFAHVGGQIIII